MSLYKQGSIANEVMLEMAKNLKLNRLENKHAFSKLASAVDHLAAAAEIFDNTGYSGEAEVLVRLMERLSEKQVVKTAAFHDFSLSPKDREFFDKLPATYKEHLLKLDFKELAEKVAELRMAHELKEELKQHNEKKPEVIQMQESLLYPKKSLPSTDRADEIIVFDNDPNAISESLKANDKVASAIAGLAAGKKKAS